jgi:hypothetical protein
MTGRSHIEQAVRALWDARLRDLDALTPRDSSRGIRGPACWD